MTLHIGLLHYLVVAALLFGLGLLCVLTRRNAIGLLMGIELMLNAATVNLVAFGRFYRNNDVSGQVFALFVMVLAAAEAAVAMAIVLAVNRSMKTIQVSETVNLKE
jgi:NADH-quinone oxidoreductase subunit K